MYKAASKIMLRKSTQLTMVRRSKVSNVRFEEAVMPFYKIP